MCPPALETVNINGATSNYITVQLMLPPTMSLHKAAPSRALLSHLCRSPPSVPSLCLRSIASRQVRCQSSEKNSAGEGKSFKGQLYESTSTRLARERAERERFSKERKEGPGGRNLALTFGRRYKIASACSYSLLLTLFVCSDHCNSIWRLLFRNSRYSRSVKRFYDPSLRDYTP